MADDPQRRWIATVEASATFTVDEDATRDEVCDLIVRTMNQLQFGHVAVKMLDPVPSEKH